MIRPSALQLTERCDLAPWLAREYPSTSEAAERGTEVDREVCRELGTLDDGGYRTRLYQSADPDVRACVEWVLNTLPDQAPAVQERIELVDPITNGVITAGTPDIVGSDPASSTLRIVVVDLKKREQWYAARLAPPDENLQLHAYGIAHALRSGAPEYKTCALLFGDGEVEPLWSRTYTAADWRPILDRIKQISSRVMNDGGTRPKGFSGPHCTGCYQRMHCPHWMLPAAEAGANALTTVIGQAGLTKANADRAVLMYMQLGEAKDLLGEMLKAFADVHGPIAIGEDKQWGPTQSKGRKSADVQALIRDGLLQYVKQGRPSMSYRLGRRDRQR